MTATDHPVTLHTRQFGEGPSLIILHGLFGSWENWRSHAQQLSTDFQVTLMDLRNHGQSEHRAAMNYPAMAADVAFTCQQLGIERTHVLGHSMGGKTAMQLTLTQPSLVERLIVVDISPRKYPAHHKKILRGLSVLASQSLESRKRADDILSEFVSDQGIRSFLLKNLLKTDQGIYKFRLNLDAIINRYDDITAAIAPAAPLIHSSPASSAAETTRHDSDSTEHLEHEPTTAKAQFNEPVLFIKGADSDYLLEKDRPAILELFPAARVKVVAGTGHWLHSEKPAIVQKIIKDFLTG